MAVSVGTQAPVRRDTKAQVWVKLDQNLDERQKESQGKAKQATHHCNTSTRSILLRRTCRKMQVDINRFWNL